MTLYILYSLMIIRYNKNNLHDPIYIIYKLITHFFIIIFIYYLLGTFIYINLSCLTSNVPSSAIFIYN